MKKKVRALLPFPPSWTFYKVDASGLVDGRVWQWEDVYAFSDLVSILSIPVGRNYNVFLAQITPPP